MNIKWTHPTGSGLCDRLLDIMLMSAFGKTLNADIYLDWILGAQGNNIRWYRESGDERSWDKIRYLDYKYENFSQYIILPSNIKINQTAHYDRTFDSYVGGVYSPYAFYNLFVKHCSLEDYLEAFKQTMNEFRFSEKLLNMVSHLPKPDISVHLRRADKIRTNPDCGSIALGELSELNELTMSTLNKLNVNSNIFFASDEDMERFNYESKYNSIKEVYKNITEDYEKTYIDLYLLSESKYIILSQKHSNFSILASLIKGNKLIYFYKESLIEECNFNMIDNIIYYKNL